jgi:copper resistance protein C
MKKSFLLAAVFAVCLFASCRMAFAHAILVASTPKVHGTVHGPGVDVDLKFNSRVDATRSHFVLIASDGKPQSLTLSKQAAPQTLSTHANLKPGTYTLRWQALSADGHITRGEIPFTVE